MIHAIAMIVSSQSKVWFTESMFSLRTILAICCLLLSICSAAAQSASEDAQSRFQSNILDLWTTNAVKGQLDRLIVNSTRLTVELLEHEAQGKSDFDPIGLLDQFDWNVDYAAKSNKRIIPASVDVPLK